MSEIIYNQEVAFVNRNEEINYLKEFLRKKPLELLFIYCPESSGKTTLLYKIIDQVTKEEKYDIKLLNLNYTAIFQVWC